MCLVSPPWSTKALLHTFGANVALVRPDTVVALLVHLELAARRECARTAITGERLLAGVRPHVLQHIAFLRK